MVGRILRLYSTRKTRGKMVSGALAPERELGRRVSDNSNVERSGSPEDWQALSPPSNYEYSTSAAGVGEAVQCWEKQYVNEPSHTVLHRNVVLPIKMHIQSIIVGGDNLCRRVNGAEGRLFPRLVSLRWLSTGNGELPR